ncbi:MAG: EAL domain-containing protein [Pyrinomonadaceae bacterium]
MATNSLIHIDTNPRPHEAKPSILIIDDDKHVRNLLVDLLSDEYHCTSGASAEDALAVLGSIRYDLIVSDINMGGISGLDLVPLIHRSSPDTVVLMISGQQTIESAIEAMHAGAFDYITKPFSIGHVKAAVHRALEHHRLLVGKRRYETHLEELIKERTAEIKYLAYYDPLTDLPNRVLFMDRCDQALAIAQHNQQIVGIMLVSLDRFKKIADTLGHEAGDQLLGEVGARLHSCIRKGDTVARFDGEEFALLLTRLNETGDLAEISLAIKETLKPSFPLGDQEVFLTASIGISLFPFNGENSAIVLKNAGAALYRAKRAGGNTYQFYNAEMNSRAIKRLGLETSLRHAIENKEFVLHYQPRLAVDSLQITGVEALIRWRHPRLGLVPPGEFIPLAEDTGLIIPIGEWVLQTACVQNKRWQNEGFAPMRMAVNIAAQQLRQPHFAETVMQILHEAGLQAKYLELELTETSVMNNAEFAIDVLGRLKNMGVKISIDDFGTGFSSLSYLKRLPIDALKIDQSFVRDLATDPDDAALVTAIITLAHSLRLEVVAEGVETAGQFSFLSSLKCDEIQGFLFSKGLPVGELASLMRSHAARSAA